MRVHWGFDAPRSLRCGLQRHGNRSEQTCLGTGGGEGQADAREGLVTRAPSLRSLSRSVANSALLR